MTTLIILLAINMLTFTIYGIDKYKAIKWLWRIPESRLLLLAAMGGSIGALLGMIIWQHKTLHIKFICGIPLILALQALLILYIVPKTGIQF